MYLRYRGSHRRGRTDPRVSRLRTDHDHSITTVLVQNVKPHSSEQLTSTRKARMQCASAENSFISHVLNVSHHGRTDAASVALPHLIAHRHQTIEEFLSLLQRSRKINVTLLVRDFYSILDFTISCPTNYEPSLPSCAILSAGVL